MFDDFWVYQLLAMQLELAKSALLISSHQSAVSRDIASKYRRKASAGRFVGHLFIPPGARHGIPHRTSGTKSPYGIRCWKCLRTRVSPLGTEIASVSPLVVLNSTT